MKNWSSRHKKTSKMQPPPQNLPFDKLCLFGLWSISSLISLILFYLDDSLSAHFSLHSTANKTDVLKKKSDMPIIAIYYSINGAGVDTSQGCKHISMMRWMNRIVNCLSVICNCYFYWLLICRDAKSFKHFPGAGSSLCCFLGTYHGFQKGFFSDEFLSLQYS